MTLRLHLCLSVVMGEDIQSNGKIFARWLSDLSSTGVSKNDERHTMSLNRLNGLTSGTVEMNENTILFANLFVGGNANFPASLWFHNSPTLNTWYARNDPSGTGVEYRLYALALNSRDVGFENTSTGTGIKNTLLVNALQDQLEFTDEGWNAFKFDTDLSFDCHVNAGGRCFKPEITWQPCRLNTVWVDTRVEDS
mmetsp:Transcript_82514/g.133819  ORF Transcript_82514/g.133819 Transcript_82514/m.133819 type:complete len:195 (+) Transcript_82514:177-761(+)